MAKIGHFRHPNKFLFKAVNLLLGKNFVQNRLRNGENNTKKHGGPKSINLKSADDFCTKHDDQRIDHKQKQAKCDQRDRQGKKYQNWLDKDVEQT